MEHCHGTRISHRAWSWFDWFEEGMRKKFEDSRKNSRKNREESRTGEDLNLLRNNVSTVFDSSFPCRPFIATSYWASLTVCGPADCYWFHSFPIYKLLGFGKWVDLIPLCPDLLLLQVEMPVMPWQTSKSCIIGWKTLQKRDTTDGHPKIYVIGCKISETIFYHSL